MKTQRLLILPILAALAAPARALEIPLGGATEAAAGGGTSVGYVDMDRIFQIYPQTQVAKEDYAKQLQKKREQLQEKEAQLNSMKSRLAVLESTAKDMGQPAPDGAPAPDGSAKVAEMREQLQTQMTEYEELRKQAEKDLAVFQGQQSQIILGKIYQALRDLAQEEQVTLVVDKSSILYGDTAIDLTDKLQNRVRGY